MPELRDAQVVELFHLAFLQVLQARLDQARYVLKGGANLRYFFDSVRYSEDIVRHEAPYDRAGVKGLRRGPVAAGS
jgi:hypothetical protein